MRPDKLTILLAVGGLLTIVSASVDAQGLAIVHGRVMDPETGLDAVRHVLVDDGRITALSEEVPDAAVTIDASGLIVAPGFIDLHAHGQDLPSNRFQAADGVTTALELEIGTWPVTRFFDLRRDEALINYGTTVSHVVARHAAAEGDEDATEDLTVYFQNAFGAESARRAASEHEIAYTLELLREGMRQGALGFGFGITYTPGATHEEIFRAFAAAARTGRACIRAHPRVGSHGGRPAGANTGGHRKRVCGPSVAPHRSSELEHGRVGQSRARVDPGSSQIGPGRDHRVIPLHRGLHADSKRTL